MDRIFDIVLRKRVRALPTFRECNYRSRPKAIQQHRSIEPIDRYPRIYIVRVLRVTLIRVPTVCFRFFVFHI